MSKFLVMVRGPSAAWAQLSPAEQEDLLKRYAAYTNDLKERGHYHGGGAPTGSSRRLDGASGTVRTTDGPFVEGREALQGYWLIEANDLDHAVSLSRDCPCFLHGETLDVTPVSG